MTSQITDRMTTLIDESDIIRLLTRYAWCVDDKRWDDWAACFTDDTVITMPFASRSGREGLADWGRTALEPFDSTHHMSTNFEIVIDGDQAAARSKFQAVHVHVAARTDQHFIESGTYRWEFARTPDGTWLISSCTISVSWTAGKDETGLAGG
ncbi:nuclear transport factor 2 family protein [Rhodococcus sp. JVH1]|uniref:nuclear transport factor 2 family protein n=1 Tax=Rhodococcus sp. JVH1 TaxID=745408 RepID=UPI000272134A|nr:nuclear transport factor 2 family protein [Rhodococcus sp. JVH1]EJI95744.1 hypothetical protein JVH1_6765 [Rhodococcus sp. JVH1]